MKKYLFVLLAILACLMLAACGNTERAGQGEPIQDAADPQMNDAAYGQLAPVELIMADSTGKGSAGQIFGEYLAERVFVLTGGKLSINYYPNGALGGDTDLMRQVQSNDIQMLICQTAPVVAFLPKMAVFDLPMAFVKYDGDTIEAVLNGDNDFHRAIAESYEQAGLHLLGFLQNGTYRLATAHHDISTLESMKKLKIRTMENRNHMDFWAAIGAEPTPLAWGELYISLQNGTIDAQENAADTCWGASFQEVQSCLACTNHILYCNQLCINKEAYDALDPAYREALRQAVADALAYTRPKLPEMDRENKESLVRGGMTLISYDDDFYDTVLRMEKVQELYKRIDEQTGGLGTLLARELERN